MSAVRRSKQLPWLDRTTSRLASAWPPPRGDYPATVEAVAGIVRAIERETGCQGTVGVDMPGSISPTTGLIKDSNSVWMTGHPFRDGLEAALSSPVRCANDANCASVEDTSLSRARDANLYAREHQQAAGVDREHEAGTRHITKQPCWTARCQPPAKRIADQGY
jgi:hypothetical protein